MACTTRNPNFCDRDGDCDSGMTCNLELNVCENAIDASTEDYDASSEVVDAASVDSMAAVCDPVLQSGCDDGEKCTWIWDSAMPLMGHTGCALEGTVTVGGSCDQPGILGPDDCVGGTYCDGEECVEICRPDPDTCISGDCYFVGYGMNQYFSDADAGLCLCNPLLQDCRDEAESCMLGATTIPFCAPVFTGLGQGEVCMFSNHCLEGYGCLLPDDPVDPTALMCAFFCDTTGTIGPSCADGPGAGFDCHDVHEFWPDSPAKPGIGICAPTG